MKFKSISATDKISGWNVSDVPFNPMLTLLVGASGVGKTRMLNFINALRQIAQGRSYNGSKWEVMFEQDGHEYVWKGEFEARQESDMFIPNTKEDKYMLVEEFISDNGKTIVSRTKNSFAYKGSEMVKLDAAKSAVELLKGEDTIAPIYRGFSQCYSLNAADTSIHVSPVVDVSKRNALNVMLVKALSMFSPLERLFLLRESKLKEFDLICQKFQEIFPTVEKVDFTLAKTFNDTLVPILVIKEKNVPTWIRQDGISSGMMRTLLQIITLVLANDGDVIMIDEFENGLGVNCINELADLIMEPEADIQVVMTSHHPYIINAIPVKDWKILTRNGSDVHVHTAEELHIGEHSKHEAFMQLLQTPEYRTGQNR
ncbi:MAG: ATP-binding protein [Bacteroidales bacterium]|nr:ATP-binding protein [Bacteroidales bacterium]